MYNLKAVADYKVVLEKFPGRGGWTFARVPEVAPNAKAPFGWVEVKGTIDSYTFEKVKLMPLGNGQLFFPVKAAIRKAIKKQAGDEVHLTLYLDLSKLIVPEEILQCLQDEPLALQNFQAFKEGEQKAYLDWINAAQRDQTKINRIVALIERSKKGLKLGENKV